MQKDDLTTRVDKRFEWKTVQGVTILYADTSYSTEDEKIAMIYLLPQYGANYPKGVKKAYLIIKGVGDDAGIRSFRHMIEYTKKYNYFEKTACVGKIHPIWVATAKVVSPFLKNDVLLCKKEEQAIEYFLQK